MKKKLVVLTGAGMSAESGISTFRDSDGLWEKYRVEDVATPEGFAADPELVLNFYNQRRRELLNTKPNAGHIGLADLEQEFAKHRQPARTGRKQPCDPSARRTAESLFRSRPEYDIRYFARKSRPAYRGQGPSWSTTPPLHRLVRRGGSNDRPCNPTSGRL